MRFNKISLENYIVDRLGRPIRDRSALFWFVNSDFIDPHLNKERQSKIVKRIIKLNAESESPFIKNFVIIGVPIAKAKIKKTIGSTYRTAKINTIKQNKESKEFVEAFSWYTATTHNAANVNII